MILCGDFNQRERDRWVAAEAAAVAPGSRVLDVGAGTGRYRGLFSHCDYRTHDFAREPGTIGHYTPLDYESDITAIAVPDGSFDVILCTEVLEHVPEPALAVAEMARILRPGGKLLLTAPLGSFLHQEPFHFYGGYTPHWYERFLSLAGFEVLRIERNRGFFSWFAQESRRFHALIDPRRTWRTGWRWPLLSLVWLASLPFCRALIPAVAGPLDKLNLEQIATVGYHVAARRR